MTDHMSSLRVKILGSLFLVLAASMGIALFGMWTYQRDKLIEMNHQKAMQAGLTMKAGLILAMLHNDREALQATINEMAQAAELSRISLMNIEGRIVLSSDPSLAGSFLDKKKDNACMVCHKEENSLSEKAAEIIENGSNPFLRTVITVANRPPCFGCHPASQKLCGLLVVDSYLSKTYDVLRTVANRTILTGLVTFLIIVVLISYIVTRFVSRPVHAFLKGIKRIEKGDFNSWVDVSGSGEFSEMAISFNVMTKAVGRYIDEVKDKTSEITTLYTIVRRMSETIDWKRVKGIVANLLCEVLKAERVVLLLPYEKDEKRFEIVWKNKDEKYYSAEYYRESQEEPHGSVAREELEQWLAQDQKGPVFTDEDSRALVPLQLKEMKLGLVCAVKPSGQKFSNAEKKLIPALTHHIAISFANARLYNLAITDELTGLYTKRYFQTKIHDFEEAFRLTGEGFSVMMLDLDHFKEVNDTYGHPVGDRVLIQIAEVIRLSLRHGDIPCRYGGEEFVILLPGSDIHSARAIADRLRKNISENFCHIDGHPPICRTVSIGLSSCPLHAASADELVMTADSALYTAKRAGRNQVHICSVEREKV